MNDLNQRALGGLLRLATGLAVLLFVPAWSFDYWQAWLFLAVFSAAVLAITLYLMKEDPRLLERRMNAGAGAEKERRQKIIQSLAAAAFAAVIVFPSIDHRFGWSTVPLYLVVAGDVLVALGLVVIFFVFRENTFTAATIEVDPEQKVVSTGPYALVRHPMYMGALVMLAGVPLALGSWWGLFTLVPMTLLIIWRLIDEEAFLLENLPGYSTYRKRVKHRLVPFIW